MASFQHQAPSNGVTEIRVHGVGGTSPVSMLGRSDLVQVAGDEISGFYRSTETEGDRTIEAYSWGGLTASSASRALWVLLLPFSLVNIAGWMIEPARKRIPSSGDGVFARLDRFVTSIGSRFKDGTSARLGRWQAWLVHLLALVFTATYIQLTAYVAVDLFAYQCGGNPDCRIRLPLSGILGSDPEVGRRLVIGMALPVILLLSFLFLARRSRLTYESYRPSPGEGGSPSAGESPLEDPLVWDRIGYQKVMARFHGIAALGGLLITFSASAIQLTGEEGWRDGWLYPAGMLVGGLLSLGSLILVGWITSRPDNNDADWNRISSIGLWAGLLLLAVVLGATWGVERTDAPEDVITWFGVAPLGLLSFSIGIGFLIAALQALRWVVEGYLHTDQFLVVVAAILVAVFPQTYVFAGVAVVLLLLNLAAPPVEGRRTALWDLIVLLLLALIGWILSEILDQQAYLWAGVGISAVAAAFLWLARRPEPGFRWAGTGAVGAFAAIIVLGIFSGLIVRTAAWLSVDDFIITYPDFYQWAVVAVTLALLATTIALVLFWARSILVNLAGWKEEAESRFKAAQYPPESVRGNSVMTVLLRGVVEAAKGVDVMITLTGTAVFAAGLASLIDMTFRNGSFSEWFDDSEPAWAWLLDLTGWLAVLAVVGAYLAVRSGLRSEATRRKIGMVWDVASFFPRTFHPLAPPAYAARAVPEIQARIREAAEIGGRVVLTGHSQGSVISAAVMASLPDDIAKSTALVTYGSPIGKFYRHYFPTAVPDDLITRLVAKIGPRASESDPLYWVNFYRPTDPIADRAFRDGESAGAAIPDDVTDVLAGRGREALGADVELEDPWERELQAYRPLPRLRGHSGYESDPAWIGCVESLAALL